ncbi:MFS transporter [Corynebacterium poyangense]|uniref:MFS transporter n=1 Tax=Corynebacterium poyangense TaxID=2684405 RepID=A0A7H0SMF7_9CORY|nr:MFS transporter [Corynebacterium poyangense]
MSVPTGKSIAPPSRESNIREDLRVSAATTVGTAIEWYDYFLYAAAAGLVFKELHFAPLGQAAATLVAFLSVGLSFIFRPLGAVLAGHFGDKWGRRKILMITLIMMGSATTLIGLLPTYNSIGIAAPILLIFLRIVQGFSAGGEWGGAVLMAVEHAPDHRRGVMGAAPQVGVPAGLLMSSGVLAIMSYIAPGEAFMQWGWRVPFLLSFVLIIVGIFIRHGVDESPVFEEIAARKSNVNMPVVKLFKRHGVLVILLALVFAGNGAAGYMTTGGFIQNYATDPTGPIGLQRSDVLNAVTLSAASWLVFTLLAGIVSDYIGRRATYIIGFIIQILGILALFPLVNTASIGYLTLGLVLLSIGLGLTYGQQSALYAELFPASVRFSGVSVTYAIGAILGGAFAPTIATALLQNTGTTSSITVYLVAMSALGLLAILLLRDRKGIPLGPEHEKLQRLSPVRGIGTTDYAKVKMD